MHAWAYVGLGSNLGDGPAQLDQALALLQATPGIEVRAVSSYYRTPPWGETNQPPFTNAVARMDCRLLPGELLVALQKVENAAGRIREPGLRWGPRSLDLDLLLFEAHISDNPRLQLPHPYISQRAFVLVPLLELVNDIEIPGQGTAQSALAALPPGETSALERLQHRGWRPPEPAAPKQGDKPDE